MIDVLDALGRARRPASLCQESFCAAAAALRLAHKRRGAPVIASAAGCTAATQWPRVALALLCALTVTSFTPPTQRRRYETAEDAGRRRRFRGPRRSGAPDDDAMTELRERMMQEELKQRKQTIKEGKGNRLSAQYVELLTAQHPSELSRRVLQGSGPQSAGRDPGRDHGHVGGRCGGY